MNTQKVHLVHLAYYNIKERLTVVQVIQSRENKRDSSAYPLKLVHERRIERQHQTVVLPTDKRPDVGGYSRAGH